jgi:hypothetical protein
VDADELTYTAGSVGLKSTAIFAGGTTGVTATVTKTTSGAGGYVKNDAAGLNFTATTGDVMASIAGVKPLSGWKNATATLPNMRILAQNRGAGWNLLNFNQVCAIQLLYLIEYANFNSQTQIGQGVTGVDNTTAGNTFNNALNTGFTAGVGTSSTDLGNASGVCTGVIRQQRRMQIFSLSRIAGLRTSGGIYGIGLTGSILKRIICRGSPITILHRTRSLTPMWIRG